MKLCLIAFAFTLACTLAATGSAEAQRLPGYHGDYDAAVAEYRAYAMGELREVIDAWLDAIARRDAGEAASMYAEDATIYLGAEIPAGEGLEAGLERWLRGIDGLQTGLRDFDASGAMSYATLNVLVNAVDPDAGGAATMLVVLKKEGGWKIRSQALFMTDRP